PELRRATVMLGVTSKVLTTPINSPTMTRAQPSLRRKPCTKKAGELMPTNTVIGDFRTVPDNAPREEVVAPAPTPEQAVPAPEVPEEALTPAEGYRKRLAAVGVSLEEASGIFDAVLSHNYYEETVRFGKGSRRAVFRTRQYEDTLRLQRALELERPGLGISQDDLITRYNLAASLYEWDGKVLKHDDDKDFENVLKLVRSMPAPLYSLLTNELAKFDRKTLVVFSDGAAENFS
ncbi:MAG: hypothetical protein ACRC8U_05585, partial [Brooklawnia sp.]